MTDELREAVARAIAHGLGDDFDHAFASKAEWIQARCEKGGRMRDINEPMQCDYLEATDAALAAIKAAGYAVVPQSPGIPAASMTVDGMPVPPGKTVADVMNAKREENGDEVRG